ncbi:NAD(P)-binding protein [Mytilinidion resinicola]|uniref:NAD(P)-binding protein n=1 Tax=Mytilinidion resinicola TaxID=574789 RepID=A0A6A6Y236_9PEZI|nr:NAD(P)-binding protein [Mytilinidion resinicola]KAF2802842.1 NAD(P)-binding protein [Mytilinidion resinicola]
MAFLAAFIKRQFISYPPIPTTSFSGKTAIVTGSNVGLGLEACRYLVRLGASQIIIACRNTEKGEAAAKEIQASTSCPPDTLKVWQLDMSSYASVQAFADRAKAELPRLDILLLNAGLGTMKFRMAEGLEETINTNVVSLSLLAFLLHPKLHDTAVKHDSKTHLTATGSELYEVAKFAESKAPDGQIFASLSDQSKANMLDRYNTSKLLLIFVIKQIAALAPLESSKVIVNCVGPGFCQSELHRDYTNAALRFLIKILARPTEVGSRTLVYGAGAGPETHGQYLPDCKITATKGLTSGEAGTKLQNRVWVELKQKLEVIRPGVTWLA